MKRIEIKKWNGQFDSPKVVAKIRRKIAGVLKQKETVLIDFEDVGDIPLHVFMGIVEGWDDSKVKLIPCRKEGK